MFKMSPTRILEALQIDIYNIFSFFGEFSVGFPWEIKEDLPFPTAATNGYRIFWDPNFLLNSKYSDLLGVALHEISHIYKKHALRMGDRHHILWNMATDYHINAEIRHDFKDNRITLPNNVLYDKMYLEWLEEDIYEDLKKDNVSPDGSQIIGGVFVDEETIKDMSKISNEVDRAIERGVLKSRGILPGSLRKYIQENREPQIDPWVLFKRTIEPMFPRGATWDKFNKKMIGHSMYFPGVKKDGVLDIVMAHDTSGSMSIQEIGQNLVECENVCKKLRPRKSHTIFHTCEVWKYTQKFEMPTEIQSGGTDFQCVFDFIEEHGIKPRTLVMLTDGEAPFPSEPNYEVIWITKKGRSTTFPYGKVIYLNI